MVQKMHAGLGVENSGIRKFEDAAVVLNVILLKWVLKKANGRLWAGLIWLRIQPSSLTYSQQPASGPYFVTDQQNTSPVAASKFQHPY